MKKIIVASAQYAFQYGNNIRFPYSISLLLSYCKTNKLIEDNFKFEKVFLHRKEIEKDIESALKSDILLLANYAWNWSINLYLASEVKKRNKNCLIIFGGPNIPSVTDKNFFIEHSFIDILIHGEGEIALQKIFLNYLNNLDYKDIKGVETKDYYNEISENLNDLNLIPSPYLTEFVWDLVEKKLDVPYIASWETIRGCPYSCAFCVKGKEQFEKKRRTVDMERVKLEIEWFGNNKIDYIDFCDTNYGMLFDRELEIAKKFKEVKKKTGFPNRTNQSWTKTISKRIIEIAKKFRDEDLLRGITIALQSMDKDVLTNVKRRNVSLKKFDEFSEICKNLDMLPFIDIIIGLPGETLEGFKKGLDEIMNMNNLGTFYLYKCSCLTNTEMNNKEYRDKFKIKTIKSPIHCGMISIDSIDKKIQEYDEILIETYSYTKEELKEMYLFGWKVLTFYTFGIFEQIMKYFKFSFDINYVEFFEIFDEYCKKDQGLFGNEYSRVKKYVDDGYDGKGWDLYDRKYGDITWYCEQMSWLILMQDKNKLEKQIKNFLKYIVCQKNLQINDDIIKDLIKFQIYLLTTKEDNDIVKVMKFNYDWKNYLLNKSEKDLEKKNVKYSYENLVIEKEEIEWNYQIMRYGRGRKKYKIFPLSLNEVK